jgi:uncharacterized protein YjbK
MVKKIYIEENEYFGNMISIKSKSNYNMGIYAVDDNHFCIEIGEDNQMEFE